MSEPIVGHCLCGAVRITVSGDYDPRSGACHCRMCQRWSGGLFLCFNAEKAGIEIEGPVAVHASPDFAERAFCSVCGSHLWFRDTGPDETIYGLMPGLFDAARDWPLRSEIYIDRAMTAARLSGNHPRKTKAEYEATNQFVEGDAP